MSKKLFLAVAVLFAAALVSGSYAQKQEVEVPETVTKYLASHAPAATNVSWTKAEDEKDVYLSATYTDGTDTRTMIFRNGAYYATKTAVRVEWCPKGIRLYVDTVTPGFKIKELYYETTQGKKGYYAVIEKVTGKGKKAVTETRDMLFSLKGAFLEESDTKKTVRGF